MLRFENSYYFHLLWLLPTLIVFFMYVLHAKKKALQQFGNPVLLTKLATSASRSRQFLKWALLLVAVAVLSLVLARPQIGTKLEEAKREGVDVMIAVDVSVSMLARDIPPSRLEKAKHEVDNFINRLQGDRVGLIAFSGTAFVQCPLTLDYGAAKMFLDILEPGLIPTPGTNIGQALELALKSFETKDRQFKVLILITDGENHEGDVMKLAEEAERQGVIIHCVGIGSPEGVPIPQVNDAGGFKKDRDGQVIMSKLDEVSLEKIALQTNGKYYRASSGEEELKKIYDDIAKMEKKELGSLQYTQFEDRYQYLLIFVIIFLMVEILIPERRKIKQEWRGRFN
jgi:Ca-activated chloride channel homolog